MQPVLRLPSNTCMKAAIKTHHYEIISHTHHTLVRKNLFLLNFAEIVYIISAGKIEMFAWSRL